MGLFSDDSGNERAQGVAEAAQGGSVTERKLTNTSSVATKPQYATDEPIIRYFEEGEQPHYFFHSTFDDPERHYDSKKRTFSSVIKGAGKPPGSIASSVIITNLRVIFFIPKTEGDHAEAIPYQDITGVEINRGIGRHRITIQTSEHNYSFWPPKWGPTALTEPDYNFEEIQVAANYIQKQSENTDNQATSERNLHQVGDLPPIWESRAELDVTSTKQKSDDRNFDSAEILVNEKADKYWGRIKISLGVLIVGFILAIIAIGTLPAGVEGSEVNFSTYPLRNTLLWIWLLSSLFAGVLFWHSLYRDKQELSKDFPDVKERHWITIGVFSYFTAGFYPLWYLFARYKRTTNGALLSGTDETPDRAGSNGEDTKVKEEVRRFFKGKTADLDTSVKEEHQEAHRLRSQKEAKAEIGQSDKQETTRQTDQRQQLKEQIRSFQSAFERIDRLIESEDLEQAREQLVKLESDITSAKNTADEEGFNDLHEEITTLEQRQQDRLTDLDERIDQRDELTEDISSLRGKLSYVTRLINNDEFETALDTLTDLEPRLESVKSQTYKHDFKLLHDEIVTLEQRHQDRLEKVTERLELHPIPDRIPQAPNVSVEYEALTDREPIGGGGNADVTKATLLIPAGDVTLAIKEPRMSGTLHTDQVERMLQEAETWDKLDDHDHIVGVVDYGSEPIPWIAMEYMDGGHLGEQRGAMDIPQALWTAIAVTKGVRHAHRRGVAHLDLKPENILFRTVEDAWDVPKVADWGLSKHLLEHSKSVEGMSVEYAAPEQFDDDYGQTDDITDIYQLGAVFYELFTGRPPFEGQPFKIIDRVKTEQPTPPSEIAHVPDGLDDILLTALAKEKADRYDTVEYLRDALQDLFDEY